MSKSYLALSVACVAVLLPMCGFRTANREPGVPDPLEAQIRADESFLASDELHGRGSGTRDEHLAALYCASQLQAAGLEGGGDGGSFVQKVALPTTLPRGLQMRIARLADQPHVETWNAVGILRGTDPARKDEVILLSAHLDHLGMARAGAAGKGGFDLQRRG